MYISMDAGMQRELQFCGTAIMYCYFALYTTCNFRILPFVKEDDMRCTGLLEIADANGIIILFPQAELGFLSLSGLGTCWDFVGYSGVNYGKRRCVQVILISLLFYVIYKV